MNTKDTGDDDLEFDSEFAQRLIGKHVLIGVTVQDGRGEFTRQVQFHGSVLSADAIAGITIRLKGVRDGEEKWLPPATNVFESAEPGVYKLRSTGEEVVDPDFTATWLLRQPDA